MDECLTIERVSEICLVLNCYRAKCSIFKLARCYFNVYHIKIAEIISEKDAFLGIFFSSLFCPVNYST